MSIKWGLDKQNVVYPYNRILFCNKNNKEMIQVHILQLQHGWT